MKISKQVLLSVICVMMSGAMFGMGNGMMGAMPTLNSKTIVVTSSSYYFNNFFRVFLYDAQYANESMLSMPNMSALKAGQPSISLTIPAQAISGKSGKSF
jgi:hypothetical protein